MMVTKTTARLVTVAVLAALGAVPAWAQTPAVGAPESHVSGKSVFTTYCASCHGESGRGNGTVAIFLRRAPADLTQIAIRNKGTFPAERVFQQIDGRQVVKPHGESQMPVWGDAFSKSATNADERAVREKITALVAYLESIQEHPAR
jgi:mono/diheme cytochrome c family protein